MLTLLALDIISETLCEPSRTIGCLGGSQETLEMDIANLKSVLMLQHDNAMLKEYIARQNLNMLDIARAITGLDKTSKVLWRCPGTSRVGGAS
jgi:hypothetical protein